MFVSTESIEALRKKEDDKLAKAKRERDLVVKALDALPANSPVPESVYAHGYCAVLSITFEGAGLVPLLLKLYPPLPVVDVCGGTRTQKPVKYLRGEELRDNQMSVHPVLYRSDKQPRRPGMPESQQSAQWWTSFPFGDAQITVRGIDSFENQPPGDKFSPDSHTYATGATTFFYRNLLAEPVGQPAPLVAWENSWDKFILDAGFNGRQQQFINVLRHMARSHCGVLTMADLPEPHYIRGGTAVAIHDGEDMVQKLEALQQKEANRAPHVFDHVGDFWGSFDRAQADELLAFVNSQVACLPSAEEEHLAATERVRAALLELFSNVSGYSEQNPRLHKHVAYWLRKKTGLDVQLAGLYLSPSKITVWTRFVNTDRGLTLEIPTVPQARRLLFQDIPVDYA